MAIVELGHTGLHVYDLDTMRDFYERGSGSPSPTWPPRRARVLDHGNAIGIYFLDPEGNKLEVYWQTGLDFPQPFGKKISLRGSAQDVLAEHERLVADGGRVDSQPGISA